MMVEVRKYSSRHLEIKFILPFAKKKVLKKNITYYLFTPDQLNVNATTTSLESMRHKFKTHGRYASPELSLDELINENNKISPLFKLNEYIDLLKSGETLEISDIEFTHEAQATVNTIRHQLVNLKSDCYCLIKEKKKDELYLKIKDCRKKRKIIESKFTLLINDIKQLKLKNNMFLQALLWADEACSLTSEQYTSEILGICEKNEEYRKVNNILSKIINHENRRRKNMGYESNKDLESLAYRRESLRKWSKSVLRLEPMVSKTPKRINEIVAGVAASLAMTFTLIATFFAQSYFAEKTIRWELLVIIIYVFKDRIKDAIKRIFNIFQPSLVADEIYSYISPRTGKKVCSAKNNLQYKTENTVNKKVRDVRREISKNPFYKMFREESVVKFSHYLKIYPLVKNKDIYIRPWLTNIALVDHIRMDDWFKEMIDNYLDIDNINEPNNSVYHIHLIIEDKINKKESQFYHYLVVLDYSGILYVKEMNDKSIPTSYELTQQLERRRIKREKKIQKQQRLELSKKKISKEKDSEITE
ncbi:MAG: hypothetical protein ACPKM0_11275 [Pleomorphochaeta sp.]